MTRLLAQLGAFWRGIEPGLMIDPGNTIERWDGRGEGRAVAIAFEGLGFSFTFFIRRTPPAVAISKGEEN